MLCRRLGRSLRGRTCDNFLYGFKGAPSARQAGPCPAGSHAKTPSHQRGSRAGGGSVARSQAGSRETHRSGAAACRALWAEALRARRCRQSAVPAPAGSRSRQPRAHHDRAARTGRAVLLAPGILSPCKITVKGARCARVANAMALRATLECDLPRQDLGTYQEDGGKVEVTLCASARPMPSVNAGLTVFLLVL